MAARPEWQQALEQVRSRLAVFPSGQPTGEDARAILAALRTGVPPQRGAVEMSVDRDKEFLTLIADIQEVASGSSQLLVINGPYGAGKSHLLHVLREIALSKDSAVSLISLTHRECPLHDLLAVYQHIVRCLEIPSAPKGQALQVALERWATSLYEYSRGRADAALAAVRRLPREFQSVLAAFYSAARVGDSAGMSLVLSWLRGELGNLREARRLGVDVVPTGDSALWMLGNLARILRFLKLSGLVVLFDEAETIASVPRLEQREAGYRNLRCVMESGRTPFCYFVYATTPDFMDHSREFLGTLQKRPKILEIASLGRDDLIRWSLLIRDLHLQSYTWPNVGRVKGSKWLRFVRALLESSREHATSRAFGRTVVAVLDMCQRDPDLSPEATLAGL